jgi:ubiquinone/menaquinone biosynthesis C-methylase UbiE
VNPFKGYILSRVLKKAEMVCRDFNGRILDLGCGKGEFLKSLASYPDLRVFGLDIREGQLFYAKDSGVPLVQGDLFFLPFKDSAIDTVTCLNTIFNFYSLQTLRPGFREILRVMKKDGRIVIDIRNKRNPILRIKYWWHMSRGHFPTISYIPIEIKKEFEGLGCVLERVEPVGIKIPFLTLGYIMVFRKGNS